MGFFNVVSKVVQSLKYGKQIGKISKSGMACYAKKGGNGCTTYTTVNTLTGEKVLTKNITKQSNGYSYSNVWNAKGDLIAHYEQVKTPVGYGLGSYNSHACKVRNISERYNKFGQVTDKRDITFTPASNATEANITYSINGKNTTKFLDTADNWLSPEFAGHVNFLQ